MPLCSLLSFIDKCKVRETTTRLMKDIVQQQYEEMFHFNPDLEKSVFEGFAITFFEMLHKSLM